MFLSRLINTNEASPFALESFEEEDFGNGQDGELFEGETGCVKLPVGRGLSLPGGGTAEEQEQSSDSENEEEISDRLARLEREAYEKGFEQGRKDGLVLEKRHMDEKGRQLEALFNAIDHLKEQIYAESEAEVLKVGLAVARKIIGNEVSVENHVIEGTIRSALKFLVDRSHLRIRISPDDMDEVKRLLPSLSATAKVERLEILEDTAIGRGGCILETGFGRINAAIEDQLEMLEKEVERAFESSRGVSP